MKPKDDKRPKDEYTHRYPENGEVRKQEWREASKNKQAEKNKWCDPCPDD